MHYRAYALLLGQSGMGNPRGKGYPYVLHLVGRLANCADPRIHKKNAGYGSATPALRLSSILLLG